MKITHYHHQCLRLEPRLSLQQRLIHHYVLLQKTAFSLVKSRLALGSPGWLLLLVTMPKMAEYTEK